MKLTKTWFCVPFACFVLVACLVGCQNELSDEAIDKTMESMVDALMEHPRYLEYLDDDEWVVAFTESLMEHPMYQTTPEEDCAIIILMAAVMSGDYTLPQDSVVDRLCAWHRVQVGGE